MYRPATHLLRHSTDHRLAFWFPESDVPCHQALNVFSAACEGDPMVLGELPICGSQTSSPKNFYSVETKNYHFQQPRINPVHDWGVILEPKVGVFQFVQAGTKSETTVGGIIIIIEFNGRPYEELLRDHGG